MSQLPSNLLLQFCQLDEGLTDPVSGEPPPPLSPVASYLQWQNDPIGFMSAPQGLRGEMWSKQREICESVRDNRLTAVRSCHGTGKSKTAARVVCWWLACHEPGEAMAVTTAPTKTQVEAILWREINREHTAGNLPGECFLTHWHIAGQLVGLGHKPADGDMAAFQGLHVRHMLVIIDEACGISPSIWNAAQTLTTSEDSRVLAIGNPDDPSTDFANACKAGSGFKVIGISAYDSPNFTGEPVSDDLRRLLVSPAWVDEKRRQWGEGSPMWISKVLGQFPEIADDALFSQTWLNAAKLRELEAEGDKVLAVDIARFGIDKTQAYFRHGRVARLVLTLAQRDLMYVTGSILQCIDEHQPDRVHIDDAGLGGGVTDRLMEIMAERRQGRMRGHQCPVIGINVGTAASKTGEDKFINLRGELHWTLAQAFREGKIDVEDDDELLAQLGSIKYRLDSKGRIIVETKDEMKSRHLPSPDKADALMLAWAPPQKQRMVMGGDFADAVRQQFVSMRRH